MQHKSLYNINWIPWHISLEISRKKEIVCGLRGEIWAKLGQMLWKNKETCNINRLFSYFVWEIYTFKSKKWCLKKYLSWKWRPKLKLHHEGVQSELCPWRRTCLSDWKIFCNCCVQGPFVKLNWLVFQNMSCFDKQGY